MSQRELTVAQVPPGTYTLRWTTYTPPRHTVLRTVSSLARIRALQTLTSGPPQRPPSSQPSIRRAGCMEANARRLEAQLAAPTSVEAAPAPAPSPAAATRALPPTALAPVSGCTSVFPRYSTSAAAKKYLPHLTSTPGPCHPHHPRSSIRRQSACNHNSPPVHHHRVSVHTQGPLSASPTCAEPSGASFVQGPQARTVSRCTTGGALQAASSWLSHILPERRGVALLTLPRLPRSAGPPVKASSARREAIERKASRVRATHSLQARLRGLSSLV